MRAARGLLQGALRLRRRAALGMVCVVASGGLAFVAPPRFYTLLAVGTWLLADAAEELRHGTSILLSVRDRQDAWRPFLLLYAGFVVTALAVDQVAGLRITSLWTYPTYSQPWQYATLYLLAYPAGGLFTYSLLRAALGPGTLSTPASVAAIPLSAALVGLAVLAGLMAVELTNPPTEAWFRIVVFGGLALLALLVLELLAYAHGSPGPLRVLATRPTLFAPVILLSLMGAFIHEAPNLPLHEWRYQNLPITADVFGVPVAVLLGWPILFLLPWGVANAVGWSGVDALASAEPLVRPIGRSRRVVRFPVVGRQATTGCPTDTVAAGVMEPVSSSAPRVHGIPPRRKHPT